MVGNCGIGSDGAAGGNYKSSEINGGGYGSDTGNGATVDCCTEAAVKVGGDGEGSCGSGGGRIGDASDG
jgi:hypothetical protein